jgi:hypothetical protein
MAYKCVMKMAVIIVGLIRFMLSANDASAPTTAPRGRLGVYEQGRVFDVQYLLW